MVLTRNRVAARVLTLAVTPFALLCTAARAHADSPSAPEEPAAGRSTSTEDSRASSLSEIVVTAQRRKERIQDVPISISALSSDEMARRGVSDVKDLQGVVPGVSMTGFAGATNDGLISIRGVGGINLGFGSSAATSVYLDGVYLSRPDAAYFSLDDVERIEVLRGPQGTLYGRNATAGAINIITREPDGQVHGGANLSYGNFNSVLAQTSLSGPISNSWSAGISAAFDHRGGWLTNIVNGDKVGGHDDETFRVKLRYKGDALDATLSTDYASIKFYPTLTQMIVNGQFVGIGNGNTISVANDALNTGDTTSKGLGLVMNYTASDTLTLTSVTGYREEGTDVVFDVNGLATPPAILVRSENTRNSLYQELRGSYSGKQLRITFGVNYYHETGVYDSADGLSPLLNPIPSPLSTSTMHSEAAFTQAEFDLTDRVTLIGGLRYNYEDRDFMIQYPAVGYLRTGSVSSDPLLPALGINFKPNDDLLIYAKRTKGYEAPGFNSTPGPTYPANQSVTFGAETLVAYEVGIKSELLNRRLILDGAGFYYDYTGLQVKALSADGFSQSIVNAAKASVKGFEAELTAKPTVDLTLSGQVTYSDAIYDKFCEPVSEGSPLAGSPTCSTTPVLVANRAGNLLSFAPKWSAGVTADYAIPISESRRLHANVGYSYIGNRFFSAANEYESSTLGSVSKIDARLALEFGNGLQVYAYGKNLTGYQYPDYVARLSATSILGNISDPRTYGVGARYRY
jgi:iron complex outermembrane receptor protein